MTSKFIRQRIYWLQMFRYFKMGVILIILKLASRCNPLRLFCGGAALRMSTCI